MDHDLLLAEILFKCMPVFLPERVVYIIRRDQVS